MPFEFVETITVEIPDVGEQLSSFGEGDFSGHGLIIEIAAIHEGLTANYNKYSAAELEKSIQTWVSPYPKPVIKNHDPESEPVGRVMAAKMDAESDGTPFTRLQVAITDPEAIQKVASKRYLTGSVGGKAGEAHCSICNANWAEGNMFELPCKHTRGNTYKGKLAYIEMKNITFKEYSFVNMPADGKSHVRSMGAAATASAEGEDAGEDGWIRAARIFDLNMDKEEIVEYTESENRDVLAGMRKKDASPLYLQLKGAFLSALATEAEDAGNQKESHVPEDDVVEEEEDILAVTEELSSDLSKPEEEETPEEADEPTDEDATEDNDDEEEPVKAEGSEEEGEEKPEGQEKPSGDVDPETSKGAPVSREGDEPEADKDEEEEDKAPEESADDTDLNEQMQALESRVSELETREQALLDENAKLKSALKKGLAERVVDAKIALGVAQHDDRENLLTEHASRTASSLADALRDLAEMSKLRSGRNYDDVPRVDGVGVADTDEKDGNVVTVEAVEVIGTPALNAEDLLVERFMGRRFF